MYTAYKEQSNPAKVFITRTLLIITGIIIGLTMSHLFIIPHNVTGTSMLPNLKEGDKVIVLKHITPDIGDMVLIQSPIEPDRVLIRRIIGKEGDVIEIRSKVVYKNDSRFSFTWKIQSTDKRIFPLGFTRRDNMPAIKLDHHKYFVLGDNFDNGFDSRFFGPINKDIIIGKIIYQRD